MKQPGAIPHGGNQYEQIRVDGEAKVQMGNIHNHTYNDQRVILVVSNEIIESCKRLNAQPSSPLPIESDVTKLGKYAEKLAITSNTADSVDISKILAAFQVTKGTLDNIEEGLATPGTSASNQKQEVPEVSVQELGSMAARLQRDATRLELFNEYMQRSPTTESLRIGQRRPPSVLFPTRRKVMPLKPKVQTPPVTSMEDEVTRVGTDNTIAKPTPEITGVTPKKYPLTLRELARTSLANAEPGTGTSATTVSSSSLGLLATKSTIELRSSSQKFRNRKVEDGPIVDYLLAKPTGLRPKATNKLLAESSLLLTPPRIKHTGAKSTETLRSKNESAVTEHGRLSTTQNSEVQKVRPSSSPPKIKSKSPGGEFSNSLYYPSAWAHLSLSKLESSHETLFPLGLQTLAVRPIRTDNAGILGWKRSARSLMYPRESLLLHYTKRGMCMELGDLLRSKPMNINEPDGSYGNALQSAVAYGQKNAISLLRHHGADVNTQLRYKAGSLPDYCRNALMIAIAKMDNEMVRDLVWIGANVNIKVPIVDSALKLAVLMGNLEIVSTLTRHGAVIHDDANHLGDSLQAAAFCGNCPIITSLCDSGADINRHSGALGSALQAASCMDHLAAVCLLLQRGAQFDYPCGSVFGSALHAAAFAGSVGIIKILLEQAKADVHVRGGAYGSALHAAARQGHLPAVRTLIDAGANIDLDIALETMTFGTPLQAAVLCGAHDVVEELLVRGADVEATGSHVPKSALILAIEGNHPRLVFTLVNGGAVIEPKEKGPRPVLAACEAGRFEICAFLLERGAKAIREDIIAATKAGHVTVTRILLETNPSLIKHPYILHHSVHEGREDMVEQLLKHGVDLESTHKQLLPLQRAVRHRHTGLTRLLLHHGANPNGITDSTASPLVLAIERLDLNIVQILVAAGADPNLPETTWIASNAEAKVESNTTSKSPSKSEDTNGIFSILKTLKDRKLQSSAMRVAVEKGHAPILNTLLKHGGNADEKAPPGSISRTLLALAIERGNTDVVDSLLKGGATIESDTLSTAIAKGQLPVIRTLLRAGALLQAGEDVLLPAMQAQNRPLVTMLMEYGPKVEAQHLAAAETYHMRSIICPGNNANDAALQLI
ncbi:hypothetical protein ACN47E_003793 [Coniothyrium glycines]